MNAAEQARSLLAKSRSWRDLADKYPEGSHLRRNALASAEVKEAAAKALRPAISRLRLALAALERELEQP